MRALLVRLTKFYLIKQDQLILGEHKKTKRDFYHRATRRQQDKRVNLKTSALADELLECV